VLESGFIGVDLGALSITAFELEGVEILLNHPVHIPPLYRLIPLTFLRAVFIILFPGIDAIRAENGLAPGAFLRIFYNIGTNWAHEKICSIT
jgi:hypothetical protein